MATIHINPANKGKFNATKAKTGKSTEELTHSKNPLTRKRAIFAQNASHWKHEDGGYINNPNMSFNYGDGGFIDLVPNQELNYAGGGNLYFMGGLTGATAVQGGGEAAGQLSGMINPNTRGGGAASGALKGASMGAPLGPYGMAAGALIVGGAGLYSGGKAADELERTTFNNDMKQRNDMLGIKANGGYVIPLGVNQNQNTMFENGGNITEFSNGGSHEFNPLGGIPQGIAQDGQTNKVEQGETKWQDYIFSDRLLLDKNTVVEHNLPKSMEGKTFADASKKLSKLIKERPNDPISKNTHSDYMKQLIYANDKTRQTEESSIMGMGGRLYSDGSELDLLMNKNAGKYDANSWANNDIENEVQPIEASMKDLSGFEQNQMFGQDNVKPLFGVPERSQLNLPAWSKDPKNLRYAPIAFDALAATGLFGKQPKPVEYSPALIKQQGKLTPAQMDEQQLRNAVDASYQTGVSGLAEASGGSGSALRANLSGLNNNYMSAIGKSFADVNQANNASKMQADQFNLGMEANIAGQNTQDINRAGLYNNQLMNQRNAQNFDNRLSYLGKGAEGLGDIGYEQRNSDIMKKIYGYDQYGNYIAPLDKPTAKACGGRLKLRNHKK